MSDSNPFNFGQFGDIFGSLGGKPKSIKDIADKYPDQPKEREVIANVRCPDCGKQFKVKLKVKM